MTSEIELCLSVDWQQFSWMGNKYNKLIKLHSTIAWIMTKKGTLMSNYERYFAGSD
jgi:hypothetical protein